MFVVYTTSRPIAMKDVGVLAGKILFAIEAALDIAIAATLVVFLWTKRKEVNTNTRRILHKIIIVAVSVLSPDIMPKRTLI